MAVENSVSNDFLSTFVDGIDVFDCRLPGCRITKSGSPHIQKASPVVYNCMRVFHFPIGILGQVWYLIVLIPDLCTLTYFGILGK